MPFDTMATARLLRESGTEERQAAAITTAIKDGVTGGVATKADIAATKADIAEVKADIAEVRTDLRWMKLIGGAALAVGAVLAVLVLPRLAELV
ncbi:MAG: hypothetical protein OXE82_08375, partial [Rhodobacter sp.]|nr:hypothetical protein [Rhodobacter sp.]